MRSAPCAESLTCDLRRRIAPEPGPGHRAQLQAATGELHTDQGVQPHRRCHTGFKIALRGQCSRLRGVLGYTAAREREPAHLMWSDIDLARERLKFTPKKNVQSIRLN